MTATNWGWKRTDGRSPVHEGEAERYKNHNLRATMGLFGEQLVWQCLTCGLERSSTQYITEECPDD